MKINAFNGNKGANQNILICTVASGCSYSYVKCISIFYWNIPHGFAIAKEIKYNICAFTDDGDNSLLFISHTTTNMNNNKCYES